MAFRTRKNALIRSGKKSNYTAAEKKAFKAGMAKQYDIEHPKFGFAAAEKKIYFNDDGTVFGKPIYGKVHFFKTEKEAKQYTAKINEMNKFANEHSLEAVKSGKGGGSSLCVAEYKHIKPMRVKDEHCSYKALK